MINPRRIRWAGHVERVWKKKGVYRVLVGKPERRDHLGDPGVDGSIILRWIIRKCDMGVWVGSIWLWIGTGGRHL
jgi:hypothetical protein